MWTCALIILVMPILAAAITLLLTDRGTNSLIYDSAAGGDPVIYQHLF